MSLLKKSEQNSLAVIRLKEFELYAPAIHCCYYSCFQKIIFILKNYFEDRYSQFKKHEKDSHVSVITIFKDCYQDNIDKDNALQIIRRIKQLKVLRKRSDYDEEMITKEIMEEADKYAKEILKLIKQDTTI
jgi:uncharacterized protein (UPF0332 family)